MRHTGKDRGFDRGVELWVSAPIFSSAEWGTLQGEMLLREGKDVALKLWLKWESNGII